MNKVIKLSLILVGLILFFYLLGFTFYNKIYIQSGVLIIVLILNSIKDSLKATWQLLKLLLPFTVTLFIFGLLFQILKLQGRTDWLLDSIIKVIFFPSSFIFTKLSISLFNYKDILGLPLNASIKHEIIFMQTFFKKAYNIMPRLEFYSKLHPEVQILNGFNQKFISFCTFPLALYLFLMEEGQILRDYYENRKFFLEDK